MSALSCIYMDLDGTLVDPFPRLVEAHRRATLAARLPEIPRDSYIRAKRSRISERSLFPEVPELQFNQYQTTRISLLEDQDLLRLDVLYPEVHRVLASIEAKSIPIRIATARKHIQNTQWELETLGLSQRFCEVHCLNKSSLPTQMKWATPGLFVGDTEEDIILARHAGLRSAALTRGLRERELLDRENPDYLWETLDPIIDLLS